MKTTVSRVNRSGVYYLKTTFPPINEARSARFDIWGAGVVVAVLLSIVGLMKLVLMA